jgi:hypothetical protein
VFEETNSFGVLFRRYFPGLMKLLNKKELRENLNDIQLKRFRKLTKTSFMNLFV